MSQLSIRGFNEDLERRIREVAEERGLSLNKAAILLLQKGAGLDIGDRPSRVVGDSLDGLIGCWTAEDEEDFLEAIQALEQVDEDLWS